MGLVKCTWEVRRYTSGTGGHVPGRYGGKLEVCFGHVEMTGKKNGSPLPTSLQRKLVFENDFSTKI